MDTKIWEQLRKKWTQLHENGHNVRVEFQLVADPKDENKILAIDVVQHIDGKPVVETVQHNAGEAYAILGINAMSIEQLIIAYKEILKQLHRQANQRDTQLTVTMLFTSPSSGELRAYLEKPDVPVQGSVLVNYRHYYILSALRDKMIELLGEGWTQARVIFYGSNLDFYFEYS